MPRKPAAQLQLVDTVNPTRGAASVTDGIVDALAKRDGRAAARLMEQHIEAVERNLRLDPRTPDLASVLRPKH